MIKDWIKYWRNSLADGERMERKLSKMSYYQLETLDLVQGYLPADRTNKLIDEYEQKVNRQRGLDDPKDEDWVKLNETPFVISPFVVLPIFEHAKKVEESDKIYPFWINAVVDRAGRLLLPENKYPTFIRRALDPATKEDQVISISSVDIVDRVMEEGIPDIKDWKEYWNFVQGFFLKVTNQELNNISLQNLRVKQEFIIAIDDAIEGAGDGIIKLYDQLMEDEDTPGLLGKLANVRGSAVKSLIPEESWHKVMSDHIGQMANAYPLSFSQRQSLHHFCSLQEGDVLAVNGPPGTGKTTLLQSIVANEYVKSAIRGEDPFIMVVSSTNNQAVTNVIDSFGKAESNAGHLAERWLPRIKSYALFLPSGSAILKREVQYVKVDGTGLPTDIETHEYIEQARAYYLKNLNDWSNQDFNDVTVAVSYLREKIKSQHNVIKESTLQWSNYLSIEQLLADYKESNVITEYFHNYLLNNELLNREKAELERLLEGFYQIKESESIWLVIFSFFKFIRERRAIPYKRLIESGFLTFSNIDYHKIDTIERVIKSKLTLVQKILDVEQRWKEWKSRYSIKSNPPELFDELDLGIRHETFLLAVHYWEGRWILETEDALAEDVLKKTGEPNMRRRYHRYGMLSPCFVSTLYMVPKFFYFTKYGGGKFPKFPLLNFIDLLIIDEAGQVPPEVGAASFALAKKALVVGDIKQIDPIWKIPKNIDHTNLDKFNLINGSMAIEDLDDRGFTAGAGSVMRLAQNLSYYHVARKEAKGMMLVEHRRCFNEIIEYCNDLAYHGLLQPKRGSLKDQEKNYPLPGIGYINVSGESKSQNGSRMNEKEALEIVNWLVANRESIESFYAEPKKKFEDFVGIITPFTAQKHTLQKLLRKAGFDSRRLTVGTVHALQGAERPVVLFSSVYAANESSRSFFFDQGVNMLNVAVSRAKDSFILFGDLTIFNESSKSPSGMLIKHLKKRGVYMK